MKLQSLERNILKFRALEIVLVLFCTESLRKFIIETVKATDKVFLKSTGRLSKSCGNISKRAFEILVSEKILTQKESDDLQELIDYRNDIAHRMQFMTSDISQTRENRFTHPRIKYNYDAFQKLEAYRKKIENGLAPRYVLSLSLDTALFQSAEEAYKEELVRLHKRITRQINNRKLKHLASKLPKDETGSKH